MLSPEFLHLLGGFEAGSSTELLGRPVVCRGQKGSCRPCRERGHGESSSQAVSTCADGLFPKCFEPAQL